MKWGQDLMMILCGWFLHAAAYLKETGDWPILDEPVRV